MRLIYHDLLKKWNLNTVSTLSMDENYFVDKHLANFAKNWILSKSLFNNKLVLPNMLTN